MQVANILVLQGHFNLPFFFFFLSRLYFTSLDSYFLSFSIFSPLTSFYDFFYFLKLFVNSLVIFLGPQCKLLGLPVIVTAIIVIIISWLICGGKYIQHSLE